MNCEIIDDGTYGPKLILSGPWEGAMAQVVAQHSIADIELNYTKGWHGENVDFLSSIKDSIVSFRIVDHTIRNIDAIHCLSNVRHLRINTYCDTAINFVAFPHLISCYLEWRDSVCGLFEHQGLRNIVINRCSAMNDFEPLYNMRELVSIRLMSPSRLKSCDGVGNLPNLETLEIDLATQLHNCDDIQAATSLEHLRLHTCRKLEAIDFVATLQNLKHLQFMNCDHIRSLSPLRHLQRLVSVLFYESTNIEDGDLTPLLELPLLREVAFKNRRHYSHTMSQLMAAINRSQTKDTL